MSKIFSKNKNPLFVIFELNDLNIHTYDLVQ